MQIRRSICVFRNVNIRIYLYAVLHSRKSMNVKWSVLLNTDAHHWNDSIYCISISFDTPLTSPYASSFRIYNHACVEYLKEFQILNVYIYIYFLNQRGHKSIYMFNPFLNYIEQHTYSNIFKLHVPSLPHAHDSMSFSFQSIFRIFSNIKFGSLVRTCCVGDKAFKDISHLTDRFLWHVFVPHRDFV